MKIFPGATAIIAILLALVLLAALTMLHFRHYFHRDDHQRYIAVTKQQESRRPPVLLISMDGFRHDYIETTKAHGFTLPNFDRMIREGTRATRSFNVYPTITGPNHYSLITGLHPESHGIVLNYFIDRNLANATWNLDSQADNQDARFVGAPWPEPIWRTAQRHGRRAGNVLWPVSDAVIARDQPYLTQGQYELLDDDSAHTMQFEKRVDTMLFWLGAGQQRYAYNLDLALLYFPEPDETGHGYGPNSKQVAQQVKRLDGVLGRLLNGLERIRAAATAAGRGERAATGVDVILTSDHGMTEESLERIIVLDDYVPAHWYTTTMLLTVGALYPTQGFEQKLYDALKANATAHMQVFWRHEVPESLHYNKDNGRIAPLILIPDPGWMVYDSRPKGVVRGDHGYNNSFPESNPVFIARGPSFKQNHSVPLVHALDIYPLMCHLADFPANPNNGSFSRIANLVLRNPGNTNSELPFDSGAFARALRTTHIFSVVSKSLNTFHNLRIALCALIGISMAFIVFSCCGAMCSSSRQTHRSISIRGDYEAAPHLALPLLIHGDAQFSKETKKCEKSLEFLAKQ